MTVDESGYQGAINSEFIQVLSGNHTMPNDTSADAIFNATTNGAITLLATTTYEFEMLVVGTGFSSSAHTFNLSFTLGGGASVTSIGYIFLCQTGSTLATPTAVLTGFIAVSTASAVCASTTTTGLNLWVRGIIRMNAGGTVTPALAQVTNTAAGVIQANSFARFWPIGTNTVTNIGNNWT